MMNVEIGRPPDASTGVEYRGDYFPILIRMAQACGHGGDD